MRELLGEYPSARRALFASYHIGGCQSCAFSEEDSLAEVCRLHELEVEAVRKTIARSEEEEQKLLLAPEKLLALLLSGAEVRLIDARTREEHEAVQIPGSELLTENTLSRLSAEKPESAVVIYDHTGKSVLDHVSWFRGHGLPQTLALAGGIDAYALLPDPPLPRYRLEMT